MVRRLTLTETAVGVLLLERYSWPPCSWGQLWSSGGI